MTGYRMQGDINILTLTAVELSTLIRTREITCREVMARYLEHIERNNPQVNAIVSLRNKNELLKEAEEKIAHCKTGNIMAGYMGSRSP